MILVQDWFEELKRLVPTGRKQRRLNRSRGGEDESIPVFSGRCMQVMSNNASIDLSAYHLRRHLS
jgi:hypothetical protein